MFGGLSRIGRLNVRRLSSKISLKEPLPNSPKLTYINEPLGKPIISRLRNGMTIATINNYKPLCCVGAFLKMGTMYEDIPEHGAAQVLSAALFKGNNFQSRNEVESQMASSGMVYDVNCSRDILMVTTEFLQSKLRDSLSLIYNSVFHPNFNYFPLGEAVGILHNRYKDLVMNHPEIICTEEVNRAGYSPESPLGHQFYVQSESLYRLNQTVIENYYHKYLDPSRITLTCIGLDHNYFKSMVEDIFIDLPSNTNITQSNDISTKYVGGEYHCTEQTLCKIYGDEIACCSVGFPTKGWNDKDHIKYCLLEILLGGGESFSVGGPGKGMLSRLYSGALCKYHFIRQIRCFKQFYENTGIFGITGTSTSRYLPSVVEVILKEIKSIIKLGINNEEFERAKNQLKSSVLNSLDSNRALNEDLGRQIGIYGRYIPFEEINSEIDRTQPQDLVTCLSNITKNYDPSYFTFGFNTLTFPYNIIRNYVRSLS